jgi:hypothetical protein
MTDVLVVIDIRFCQETRKLFECLKIQKFVCEDVKIYNYFINIVFFCLNIKFSNFIILFQIIDEVKKKVHLCWRNDIFFPKFWFLPTTFSVLIWHNFKLHIIQFLDHVFSQIDNWHYKSLLGCNNMCRNEVQLLKSWLKNIKACLWEK